MWSLKKKIQELQISQDEQLNAQNSRNEARAQKYLIIIHFFQWRDKVLWIQPVIFNISSHTIQEHFHSNICSALVPGAQ